MDDEQAEKEKHDKSRVKLQHDAEVRDLREVLALPEGCVLVHWILSSAGFYRDLFQPNSLLMAKAVAASDWCSWLVEDLEECVQGTVLGLGVGQEWGDDTVKRLTALLKVISAVPPVRRFLTRFALQLGDYRIMHRDTSLDMANLVAKRDWCRQRQAEITSAAPKLLKALYREASGNSKANSTA